MSAVSYYRDKIALVTGAANGLGREFCRLLLARGAKVYALDLDGESLDKLLEEFPTGSLRVMVADVGERAQLEGIFDDIFTREKRLDFVFNNAGIVLGGEMQEMTWPQWEKIIRVNEWAVIYGSQLAYRRMLQQGFGHIVNSASTAGMIPVFASAAYSCSKHAVVGLSLSLAEEAKRYGVKVSVLVPGALKTDIFGKAINVGGYNYAAKMSKRLIQKMAPVKAAKIFLKKIAKGKTLIVVPAKTWMVIVLYRLFPSFTMSLMRRLM